LRKLHRKCGRQTVPWAGRESQCCTLDLSRVSTRNRPTFGASPEVVAADPNAAKNIGEIAMVLSWQRRTKQGA
uniref:hypothetical protein n=1 Tax=Deinococcus fonticola TaxID=2528713 RepID=UPI00197A71AD